MLALTAGPRLAAIIPEPDRRIATVVSAEEDGCLPLDLATMQAVRPPRRVGPRAAARRERAGRGAALFIYGLDSAMQTRQHPVRPYARPTAPNGTRTAISRPPVPRRRSCAACWESSAPTPTLGTVGRAG